MTTKTETKRERTIGLAAPAALMRPATVVGPFGDGQLELDCDGTRLVATAVMRPLPPAGAAVLVAGESAEAAYVIAVLPPASGTDVRVTAPDGTSAGLEATGALTIRDPLGRLLFEHDPETGVSTLSAPDGGLTLAAPAGRVRIRARDGVDIESGGVASVTARSHRLTAVRGGDRATLALDPKEARLAADAIALEGRRGDLRLEETRLEGKTLDARLDTAVLAAERAETTIGRLASNLKRVLSRIEDVWDLRAGRARVVTEGTWHQKSERAIILADRDVRIDGERIDLG